jgi:hypothetical protein
VTGWTPPLIPRSADQQERGVRLTPPALFRELEMPWWHRLTRAGAVLVPILGRVEYALPVDQVDDSQLELGVDAAPGRKRPTGGAFEHSVVWVLERQLVAGDYR